MLHVFLIALASICFLLLKWNKIRRDEKFKWNVNTLVTRDFLCMDNVNDIPIRQRWENGVIKGSSEEKKNWWKYGLIIKETLKKTSNKVKRPSNTLFQRAKCLLLWKRALVTLLHFIVQKKVFSSSNTIASSSFKFRHKKQLKCFPHNGHFS